MATSANPTFQGLSPLNQVCAHAALKVAQAASMLFPPAYVGLCLVRRRPMSVSRAMRGAELSVLGGAAVGWGVGYARLRDQSEEAIEDRVYRLKHNASQVRADDYSAIGAFMGMLVVPAIFLKRASIFSLAAGGASLGLGAGVWVHIFKSLTEGSELKPEGMASEVPDLPGKK
ncbi:hypothetical protein CcaverHIS002_0208670 [Cutaneotrichosporon cavernicola]|uniref:Uncharacterized protein n=1 Tax=Cutaneotrichosporon cavernicola TaxID=279322 RepID=A0AA48IE55_9TREE|nr:uncharacterized protein CcaverHIS019_0208680 [Cutaneotrichosporon cavernicola]BEI81707.1 hypothetical protein CcaverHIS002_0208670 [Cutaneotrichosporon cavernicola]BEI89506.1 hypothetical protein CcaverHIS019_0208680 [Cutaneotrichosporon cavernicola]BEI97279.1 hypothetical protein CcaverHIS631_0208680 [Cutaneotrichosporon cavernicola]BEJ05053.1 hypothetical protein CcaverHIS641_0208700 [Cutaneotrichosporon cavernicola]